MRILLFGASGWVGTRLAARLSVDHEVIGVVRRPPAAGVDFAPLVCPDWVSSPGTVAEALEGGCDGVVAAIGGWYVGASLLSRGLAAFDADYDTYLRAHYSACTVSADLAVDTHLALNGVASIEACAGSGAISVFGAAQQMLIRVADAESTSVRFRELRILAPLSGDDRNDTTGGVAEIGIDAVAGAVDGILTRQSPDGLVTELRPAARLRPSHSG